MKKVVFLFRIIIGCLFIFSGFVKAVDPVGTQYKMEEYFEVFHMDFLIPYALVCSFIMNAMEISLGVFTLFWVRMKWTGWLLILLMSVFLFLTGYSAITNKVTDCGCFGDFLKLSTWATFDKNVIFIILIIPIFVFRGKVASAFSSRTSNFIILLTLIFALGLQYYCLEHLPLIDFRPYKVGNNIREEMTLPPNAKKDSIVTEMFYKNKKTGEEKGYTMDNLPWKDTVWMAGNEFVRQDSKVIREGDQPKIKDFGVWDNNKVDVTRTVLDTPIYKLWVVIWDVNKSSKDGFKKVAALANECTKSGITVYGLTASDYTIIDPYRHEVNAAFPFYYSDGTVLKTMIRSNPGIMLLKGSTVLAMWHYNDTPTLDEVKKYLNKQAL